MLPVVNVGVVIDKDISESMVLISTTLLTMVVVDLAGGGSRFAYCLCGVQSMMVCQIELWVAGWVRKQVERMMRKRVRDTRMIV